MRCSETILRHRTGQEPVTEQCKREALEGKRFCKLHQASEARQQPSEEGIR